MLLSRGHSPRLTLANTEGTLMKYAAIICAAFIAHTFVVHSAFAGNARANGKGSYEAPSTQGEQNGKAKKTSGQAQGAKKKKASP